jgi:4-hydroxybutyrate CoA-transferase
VDQRNCMTIATTMSLSHSWVILNLISGADITNNPSIIGSNDKVIAINSAIEIDLTGQVCADSIGPRFISGVGGQIDFERGAALSKGK